MRVAIIGRTRMLLDTVRLLAEAGHEVALIGTCKAAEHDDIGPNDFEALAAELGASYFCDVRINSPEILRLLEDADCEVAISVNWLTVLGSDVIGMFRHGILNAHAGDLPRYRGNACPNWAILNGEERIGVCIHQMEAGELDSGPVYARDYFSLENGADISDVYRWLHDRIPQLFTEVANGLSDGTISATPQDGRTPLRCFPRRPEDGRIQWDGGVEHVHRLVRASTRPFAGAYCFLNGNEKVVVWRAEQVDADLDWLAVPGQVLFGSNGDPVIACADGWLRLLEVEVEGMAGEEGKRLILSSLRNRLA